MVLVAVLSSARAQTNVLTLADAKQLAFERNWDLLAAKSGVDAATAQLIAVKEFPNPYLNLSSAKIGERNAGTIMGNGIWQRNYDSIAAVSQLIEIGGKRRDRQLAARAGVWSAKARFYDAMRILDQGVTKAYLAALLKPGKMRATCRNPPAICSRRATIAERQHAAGDLSEADMKTIEINAEQFELQAKQAVATALQARISVEILLGVTKPQGEWVPGDSLENLAAASETTSASELLANEQRPDVVASRIGFARCRGQSEVAKGGPYSRPDFFRGRRT